MSADEYRHGQNPNGDHLRLCGDPFDPAIDLPLHGFVGLLIHAGVIAERVIGLPRTPLCPACVNGLERKIRVWRESTGACYKDRYKEPA
jgi:hypothetical protein